MTLELGVCNSIWQFSVTSPRPGAGHFPGISSEFPSLAPFDWTEVVPSFLSNTLTINGIRPAITQAMKNSRARYLYLTFCRNLRYMSTAYVIKARTNTRRIGSNMPNNPWVFESYAIVRRLAPVFRFPNPRIREHLYAEFHLRLQIARHRVPVHQAV
jgi:hypothetical protein